jgi:hypothetical protein
MQRFLTTTTAPAWSFTILDGQGNVIPNFTSASFTLTFRSVTTKQKVRGSGSFGGANGQTGQVTYTLSSTDLATVYAAASGTPDIQQFELFVEAVVGSLVYDVVPAPVIEIEKI